MALLELNVISSDDGLLYVNPDLISSVDVQQRGTKFIVNVVLASGRHYYIKDNLGKYEFDTKGEAELLAAIPTKKS